MPDDPAVSAATTVYVVTMFAVYDHGCGGVFTSRDTAKAHARSLADDSDGHHDFRIDELPLDTPISTSPRWPSWRSSKVRDCSVEFAAWDAASVYTGPKEQDHHA